MVPWEKAIGEDVLLWQKYVPNFIFVNQPIRLAGSRRSAAVCLTRSTQSGIGEQDQSGLWRDLQIVNGSSWIQFQGCREALGIEQHQGRIVGVEWYLRIQGVNFNEHGIIKPALTGKALAEMVHLK